MARAAQGIFLAIFRSLDAAEAVGATTTVWVYDTFGGDPPEHEDEI